MKLKFMLLYFNHLFPETEQINLTRENYKKF